MEPVSIALIAGAVQSIASPIIQGIVDHYRNKKLRSVSEVENFLDSLYQEVRQKDQEHLDELIGKISSLNFVRESPNIRRANNELRKQYMQEKKRVDQKIMANDLQYETNKLKRQNLIEEEDEKPTTFAVTTKKYEQEVKNEQQRMEREKERQKKGIDAEL